MHIAKIKDGLARYMLCIIYACICLGGWKATELWTRHIFNNLRHHGGRGGVGFLLLIICFNQQLSWEVFFLHQERPTWGEKPRLWWWACWEIGVYKVSCCEVKTSNHNRREGRNRFMWSRSEFTPKQHEQIEREAMLIVSTKILTKMLVN